MHLLITGASGKLGRKVIAQLLRAPVAPDMKITAVVHSRDLPFSDQRLTVRRGNIADREFVHDIMGGVTHVLHMATCKEVPELVMDVTVKGMFWMLEEFRKQNGKYFILIGGDAAMGHYFYPADGKITEDTPHRAAPGCYSLSKVLEEVLLAQSHIQYGTQGCCLRAPWIMADDDLRYALSFSEDVLGAPRWHEEVGAEKARKYASEGRIPLALAANGKSLRRGIVAVDDLVSAIVCALEQQPGGCETFNIAMDRPFDYAEAARHLQRRFGIEAIKVPTPFHSVQLSNSKAAIGLNWRPKFNTERLIDSAWSFDRVAGRQTPAYPG